MCEFRLTRSLMAMTAGLVLALAGLRVPPAAFSQAAAGPGMPFPLAIPDGFRIEMVSSQVSGARFLAVAPNGDVIVSEISRGQVVAVEPGAPAGAAPRIVARGLSKPNGLAFRGSDLYIATWSGIVVIPDYPRGIGSPRVLFDDMPRNGDHNARALALAADGTVYISSGSDCNICRETDPRLATILRYGADGGGGRIYATGLRNASGLAFDAQGRLWAVVNQRDNLMPSWNDLPTEEVNLVQEGGDYGWPTCYPDGGLRKPNPEFADASCAKVLPSTFSLPAHTAPLQAVFYGAKQFPERFRGALFVAMHGSWNRSPPSGYKVVAIRFEDGKPVGVEDFVSGWLTTDYRVRGRPVGLAVAADGSLFISDDTGYLFRVSWRG
jgi:glucose/arabinose dehydrogenase